MPEDGENCLVSVRCSNDFLVDRGTYSTDLFKVDEEHFFGKRGESGWYHLSSEYGYCKILNVIAWMPEPRPYKEIKDEGFEWIDKHLEWLDNCDNDFAQLAKVGIRAMVEIWKKDKT